MKNLITNVEITAEWIDTWTNIFNNYSKWTKVPKRIRNLAAIELGFDDASAMVKAIKSEQSVLTDKYKDDWNNIRSFILDRVKGEPKKVVVKVLKLAPKIEEIVIDLPLSMGYNDNDYAQWAIEHVEEMLGWENHYPDDPPNEVEDNLAAVGIYQDYFIMDARIKS